MNNNYFDDILKNSMETPRAIPFDEGAWDRMEQRLPKPSAQSTWKSWLKFLPIAVGMLGLLSWNIYLQREINYMQKHPNVIVEQKAAEPKVIYRIDTVYQIVEKKITEESIKNYLSSYLQNNGLSHTNNRFITPTNSNLVIPNPFITSNSNNRFSGSYNPISLKSNLIAPNSNKDFFTSSLYNPYFSNLNISTTDDYLSTNDEELANEVNSTNPVFANQFSKNNINEKSLLDSENIITDNNLDNPIETANINNLAIDETTSEQTTLETLEKKPTNEISYYQNISAYDHIDMISLSRPTKTEPTLRSQLRFEEFSIGVGNSLSGDLVTGGFLMTYGIHAGVCILPNTSIEVELNYLNHNYLIYGDILYPNNLPHPSIQSIPADFNLNAISVSTAAIQMSLGLKRIMFKDEHIRPFGEIGWLPNKEIQGDLYYSYSKREGGQTEFLTMELIPLESTSHLNWDLSQMYIGGGLSLSLLKSRASLDLGIRCNQSLNSLFRNNIYRVQQALLG